MRGRLSILVIAAALAVGLWYLFAPSDSPEVTRSDTDAPVSRPAPAVDDPETADAGSGSAADNVQPEEAAADSTADGARVAEVDTDSATDIAQTAEPDTMAEAADTPAVDSGAGSSTNLAQTTESDTTVEADDTLAAVSESDSTAEVAQASEPGTTPREDDTLAADSGTDSTTEVAQASEPGTTPREDDTLAADSGTDSTTEVAQASEPGTTSREDDTLAADSGADSTTEVAQASEPGTTSREDDTPTAGTGTGSNSTADVAQTSESVAMAAPEIAPTIGTGPVPPADAAGTTGSDAGDTEPRTAAESADRSAAAEVVLALATDGTIERTPIAPVDAPSEDETNPEDVLAAVAGGIERVRNVIEETLGIAPEEDADTALRLRIEYDDTPTDAPQTGLEPKEKAETVAADATADADAARTAGTGAESPAGDAAPPQDVAQTTDTGTGPPADDVAPSPDVAQTTNTGTEPPAGPARAIGSDGTPSTPPPRTADSGSTPPSTVEQTVAAGAAGDEGPGSEAKRYVETLAATTPPTIPVDKADHFVTQDSVVTLVPEDSIESTTVGDLANDGTLTPETPITVVREVEQIETAVPEQLIADSGGDLDQPLRIVVKYDDTQVIGEPSSTDENAAEREETTEGVIAEDTREPSATTQNVIAEDTSEPSATTQNVIAEDTREPSAATQNVAAADTSAQGTGERSGVEQITVRDALERMRTEPEKPLSIVRTVRHFEVMTLRELLASEEDDDAFLKVVLQPYRIEAATLADLLRLHATRSPDTISYLHTVQPTDEQGIWGIVHFGLIENFARGMAVRRGEEIETYTVQIPRDADERLEDQSSSFLGKLIDRKTKESYVYNFRENRMGRNPDTIFPGQEIVIINFEPGELEAIYEHFADG